VASETGHQYCGVDLRQEQVDANIEQAKELLKEGRKQPVYICGNSLNIDKLVDGKYDIQHLKRLYRKARLEKRQRAST
jgi:hypothetical protein